MDNDIGFEIDYMQVGDGKRCGDAIALRYGDLFADPPDQTTVIIDGGSADSGQALVDHVKRYYKTTKVDFVIATHKDDDHISGLKVVLDGLDVGTLLMHIPWEHEDQVESMFKNDFTSRELENELQKSLVNVKEIEELAITKGIDVVEPFEGLHTQDMHIHILGPSKDFYESLIPDFRDTPESKSPIYSAFQKAEDSVSLAIETWDPSTETLTDNGRFVADNESSVILLLTVGNKKILFTGDAGITGLTKAADYARSLEIDLSDLFLFHVPHHGSKQNVGPTILNRIKAEISQISASKDGAPKHPSQRVVNALLRRKSKVYVTRNGIIGHSYNAPPRIGWFPVAKEELISVITD